jgi:hypothetical protein
MAASGSVNMKGRCKMRKVDGSRMGAVLIGVVVCLLAYGQVVNGEGVPNPRRSASTLNDPPLRDQPTITIGPGVNCDFSTIQGGIDVAVPGDVVVVTPGEYVITVPITFRGKAIAVRSEAGPDRTTIRMGIPTDPRRASVVIFENSETAASVLEGFTITGGKGYWHTDPLPAASGLCGGGIACVGTSPTIVACIITKNTADSGGGVNPAYGASPTLVRCTISENSVPGSGGGVSCWDHSSLTMTDCLIQRNSAPGTIMYVNGNGGGIFCGRKSALTLTDCRISENSAGINGGGVMCWENSTLTMVRCAVMNNVSRRWSGGLGSEHSSLTLTNCLIAQNTATRYCGGIQASFTDSSLSIRNCTVAGNSAGQDGGAVYCWAGASLTVTNSILWGNTAPNGPQVYLQMGPSTLRITYSDLAGGATGVYVGAGSILNWGAGNIDADPLFAKAGYWADIDDPNIAVEPTHPKAVWTDGDYHLKSGAGRWTPQNSIESDPNSMNWSKDKVTSPCIDRGDPSSSVGDEPVPNGGIINMGAYGGTREASMSIGQLPPLSQPTALILRDVLRSGAQPARP